MPSKADGPVSALNKDLGRLTQRWGFWAEFRVCTTCVALRVRSTPSLARAGSASVRAVGWFCRDVSRHAGRLLEYKDCNDARS